LEAKKEKNMLVNLNIVDKRRLRAYYTTQVDNEWEVKKQLDQTWEITKINKYPNRTSHHGSIWPQNLIGGI
jgi:hypothetical protein